MDGMEIKALVFFGECTSSSTLFWKNLYTPSDPASLPRIPYFLPNATFSILKKNKFLKIVADPLPPHRTFVLLLPKGEWLKKEIKKEEII